MFSASWQRRRVYFMRNLFLNEASILCLIGAVLMESNKEWQLQRRYMPQHTMLEASTEGVQPMPLAA